MKMFSLFGILALVACGGTDPDLFEDDDSSVNGTGGESSGKGGGSGEGGDDTSDGGSTSTSSTSQASGSCQPSVTCQSVGAECGTVLDDGCGNPIDCPNNCTGNLTCGGGGDQFKCGCTPKTCLDLNAECGTASDGCGGQIECGSCGEDPYVTCGGPGVPTEFEQPGDPGQENVCNGGCTNSHIQDAEFQCSFWNQPQYKVVCSTAVNVPPAEGCELLDSDFNPNDTGWCCPLPL